MNTVRLSVPEHRYVLAGVQNVTVTMVDADSHYEPSPLGLLVHSASDTVTVTLDILYRPEPDRAYEGWTLVAFGTFDATNRPQIDTPGTTLVVEFKDFEQIILPSELKFRLFRRSGEGLDEDQHLLDMTPFMKFPGQPSGRDDSLLEAPSDTAGDTVYWEVGCESATRGPSLSITGAASSRDAAMDELIEAGRNLLRLEYHDSATAPVLGVVVMLDFATARVHGFEEASTSNAELANRINSAIAEESAREADRRAAAEEWSARPPVRHDTSASSVHEQWARITRWLRDNVGDWIDDSDSPTTNSDVASDASWPTELTELSDVVERLADRFRLSVLPRYELFDHDRTMSEQARMVEIWASVAADFGMEHSPSTVAGEGTGTFIPAFVPFAGLDGSFLVVDTRPGELQGCVTAFDKVDNDAVGPQWRSISAMLADLAASLETGSPFDGFWRPALVDGSLEWTFDGAQ
ncbi:MAG: hypothetical protein ACOH2Q_08950 [Rhodococcus sp. (in: high G+C Gram-positive bacteria)]